MSLALSLIVNQNRGFGFTPGNVFIQFREDYTFKLESELWTKLIKKPISSAVDCGQGRVYESREPLNDQL